MLLCLVVAFYLWAPDMYVLDSKLKSLRENYKISAAVQRRLNRSIQNATAVVGANHAATVRVWPLGKDENTTGVSGCLVTSSGAILATSQLLGTTDTKCVVRYWSADYNNSEVTTYTVKYCNPDRDLTILLPEQRPHFRIRFAEITTSSSRLERGEPVALGAVRPGTAHDQLTGGFFWYEMHSSVAGYIPDTFMLLDRGIDADMIGTPVFDARSQLIGLAFANHSGGEYFGEATSLVTLIGAGTGRLIAELERNAGQSTGTVLDSQ
jgi:hypothetical protein